VQPSGLLAVFLRRAVKAAWSALLQRRRGIRFCGLTQLHCTCCTFALIDGESASFVCAGRRQEEEKLRPKKGKGSSEKSHCQASDSIATAA